jgi:catechol 2,3-dioxygenase-like lactoylglutathione lyase family enzyme
MSIAIDHVGIPAADPWASARFLREILAEGEVTPEGPDGAAGEVSLSVGDSALTYFGLAAHEPHHVALRVTGPVLAGAMGRLRQRGTPFGNDPADPANGRTDGRSEAAQGFTSKIPAGTCSSCSSRPGTEPR